MHVREIKSEAMERFALNRYHAMLVYGVVYTLALNIAVLTTALALLNIWAIWYGIVLIFVFLLMLAPFGFGMTGFYLKMYRFEKMDAFKIFDGFNKYNLERVIKLRLLKFALGLAFTVLLIVPGIIFAVRTSMATYLLRANPKLKPTDALKASNRVMKSHCMKYFALVLSFAGWYLFGLLTCGLGFIWVMPYRNAAKIVFYKRELQGDKKTYRNPALEAEEADEQTAAVKLPSGAEERHATVPSENAEGEEIFFTREYIPTEETNVQSDNAANESLFEEKPQVEPKFAPEDNPIPIVREEPQAAASEHKQPAYIHAANDFKQMESVPLPGGRVYLDANGRRAVDRRSSTDSVPKEDIRVEINEVGEYKEGESVRERISRERAARAAANAAAGVPQRRASERRERKDIEIGD